MSTRMPSCDWVRMRLPLEIGPDEGNFGDEERTSTGFGPVARILRRGSDAGLDAADRARLAMHLGECASCRRHRAELLEAMSALSAVSAIAPIGRDEPSLWPALELRLREREKTSPSLASLGSLASFRSISRFRLERCRDVAVEVIEDSLDACRGLLPEWSYRLRPGVVFAGVLAGFFGGLVALQAVRSQAQSQLEIARQARPLIPDAGMARPGLGDGEMDQADIDLAAEDGGNRWLWHSSSRTYAAALEEDGHEGARSALPGPLAQAETPPHPRLKAAAGVANSDSGTSTTSNGASTSKFDFDLERGTPTDSRDAKPAY